MERLATLSPCAVALLLAIAACAPSSQINDQSPGAQIFVKNCQACHRLPDPAQKTDAEWPAIVQRYGRRAKLTDREMAVLTDWLLSNNGPPHSSQ